MIFVSPIRSAFSKNGGNNLKLRQLKNKSVTLWHTFLTFKTLRILVWYWSFLILFLVFSSTLDQDQYCCLALKCTQCSPVSVSQQGIDFTFSYYSFISNSITQSFIFQLLETRNTQQKEMTFRMEMTKTSDLTSSTFESDFRISSAAAWLKESKTPWHRPYRGISLFARGRNVEALIHSTNGRPRITTSIPVLILHCSWKFLILQGLSEGMTNIKFFFSCFRYETSGKLMP